MKLNYDVIKDPPTSAADKLSYQACQVVGQLMQMFGIGTLEYSVVGKSYVPTNIKVSYMDCPQAIKDVADSIAHPLCLLMHEFNVKKLSYEYKNEELESLKKAWSKASNGIGTSELLVAPDVTPDMEKVDIDI